MKILTLGVGACFCSAPYLYSSYLINESLLVDCGPHVEWALRKTGISAHQLSALFITHFDPDHVMGFPMLIPALSKKQPLPVFGPPTSREFLEKLATHTGVGHKLDRTIIREIARRQETGHSGYEIATVPMQHEPESVGYRIKDADGTLLAISGDTGWHEGMSELLKGLDAAILEMTNIDETREGHLSLMRDLPRILEILPENAILFLSHLGKAREDYEKALVKLAELKGWDLEKLRRSVVIMEEFSEYQV